MLFVPPEFNKKMLHHIYNSNLALLSKMRKGFELTYRELKDIENIPATLMICYLNDFKDAKHKLIDAKSVLKTYKNPLAYIYFKDSLRILRKMKYN